MKKLITWIVLATLLMIGCPWLAVTFAGSAGMAICFMLFFAINPLYSAVCGAFAGHQAIVGTSHYYSRTVPGRSMAVL